MKHNNTPGNAGSARQVGGWQKVFDGRNRQVRGLWQRGPSYYAQLKVFDLDKGCRVAKRIRLEDVATVPQAVKALADLKSSRDKNRVAAKVAPRVADYLDARMKADEKSLRPQTIMSRASMAKHLKEKLGDLRLITFNIVGDEAVTLYGRWSLRALRDCVCCGHHVPGGSTFACAGNHAVALVQGGDAEFVDDESLKREEAALEELDRINKERVSTKGHPAFAAK